MDVVGGGKVEVLWKGVVKKGCGYFWNMVDKIDHVIHYIKRERGGIKALESLQELHS